jgi:Tfp pilus assembly protein PilF
VSSPRKRGLFFFDKDALDEAIADFDMVIKLDPKDETAFAARAYLYNRKGDSTRAAADLEQARKLGWKR